MANHANQDRKFFLLLLASVSIAFGWILLPYCEAVFWAVILGILFSPLQRRLLARFPLHRNLTALTTLVASLLLAILPVIVITSLLVQEATEFYNFIQSGQVDFSHYFRQIKAYLPDAIDNHLERAGYDSPQAVRDKVAAGALEASEILASKAFSFGQGTFQFVVSFFVMQYLLFFFIRDGRDLMVVIHQAIPLGHEHKRQLFRKFTQVVRATVKGNIFIALTQGVLGGVIFAILGIPGVLLWSFVMTVLSLLPAVGAGLVWGPVAIYFMMSDQLLKSLVLTLYGVLIIGLVDNLLRPILVGKDTKMPDYVVLISTLGGLSLFGLSGFVIGPLVAALFISAWALFAMQRSRG